MADPFNVAIVGTGFGSVVHYPGFSIHDAFNPVAIMGRKPSKTKIIAEKLGADWTTNLAELLGRADVDLVSVATPPGSHKQIVEKCLNAGKHILVEKPLAMDSKQTYDMLTFAEETGLTAMVNMEFRHLPNRAYFVELLKNGHIGEIKEFCISVRNSSRVNPRARGYNWWSVKSEGGGVLNALGAIYIDFIQQVFKDIKSVYGETSIVVPRRLDKSTGKMRKVSAEDSFTSLIEAEEGVRGSISVSSVSPFGRGTRIEFYGTKGYLSILEDNKVRSAILGEDKRPKILEIPISHGLPTLEDHHHPLTAPFLLLLDDLAKGIRTGTSPSPNFEDAHLTQKIIDAIHISGETGMLQRM